MDTAEWLASIVGPEAARSLASCTLPAPVGQALSLGGLLTGVAREVTRIAEESTTEFNGANVWGADDFVGTLHGRNHLQTAVGSVDHENAILASPAVAAIDGLIVSFTEPDYSGIVRFRDGGQHHPAWWWWDRIPAKGHARDAFNEMADRRDRA